jgi:hypothetical protein
MLKPLTLSVSLAIALGACGVSFAGGHGDCATCGLASPQGSVASPQSVVATEQCDTCNTCSLPKFKMPKICLPKISLPKISLPKCSYQYEWVLKKKKVWNWGHKGGCGDAGCNTCGDVAPSAQSAPMAAPQAAPQAAPYAAGQHAFKSGEMRPALAADEVPPAPTVATQSTLLQLTPAGN